MPKRTDISSILIIGVESHSRDDRWFSPKFRLETFNQALVTGVRADPEPDDDIVLDDADGAVRAADADGLDRLSRLQPFESETRMTGILQPETVRVSRMLLNDRRKICEAGPEAAGGPRFHHILSRSSGSVSPARNSASASSASRSRASADPSNASCQRRSDAISSMMTAANASCSSSGRR